jgi:hypothetical protein
VPRGFRQAIHIGRKALFLWAWRGYPCPHETSLQEIVFMIQ